MSGDRPTYRKWLAYFVLGLAAFNLVAFALAIFDIADLLSDPWDEILSWVILALVFALLGPTWWAERRERKAGQSA